MRFLIFATAMILLLPLSDAQAKEWVVNQIDKKFAPTVMNIKVGDTLTFINAEKKKRRHNIYTKSDGFKYVKVRKQLPGDKDSIVIKNAGTIKVLCALHPRMKMTVNVTE